MVSLGGITLSDHLVLQGLETAPTIAWSSRQTFGRAVIQVLSIHGGTPLSLISENHLSLADVQAMNGLMAAGQDVELVHHRGTFTVVIVAVDVKPAVLYHDPAPEDWYSGEIKLLVK